MKAWLDDVSLHARDEQTLFNCLEHFLSVCEAKNLFLHARKCRLFTKTLKWCGRVVTGKGYRLDPARLAGLQNMSMPTTAEELSEFAYCCRWMSVAIPQFAVRIAPLTAILEEAYSRSGRRTTKSIKRILLNSLSWGPTHVEAFHSLQDTLCNAITLSYPDPHKVVCVFTDASQHYWSGVVTQADASELSKPYRLQQHEPLGFLGSAFKGAERDWTTFEKEGYAIFQTFSKMDYLLQCQTRSHVYTDHRNLLFIFAPLSLEPALGRHVVSKVQRWALFLSGFSYVIEHIAGKDNVFADILTWWTRGYRVEESPRQAVCSMLLQDAEQLIPAADDIVWPGQEVFRNAQDAAEERPSEVVYCEEDRLWKKNGRIWIPTGDLELQLKVLVVSHCGTIGHRGQDATKSIVAESFWWPTVAADADELVRSCLHCIVTRSGKVVPRPLGSALHGSTPNEVVHMDYLYMGAGREDKRYVLVIRDDLSSYIWLWPTAACTGEAAAEALCAWLGSFGSMRWVVSDQGSHFRNKLMEGLTQETRVDHHFTTAYSPWSNGSVERFCREVLRACRALLHEWRLATQDWPAVTEAVQSILNHAPLTRLGLRNPETPAVYRTPLAVFTGHIPVRPLLRALPVERYTTAHTTDEVYARQLIAVEKLQSASEGMHRDVEARASANRQRQIDKHNAKNNLISPSFTVGDFVLVRHVQPGGHKLQFMWRARRVTKVVSRWVYEIQDLIKGKLDTVHARRLLLYRSDMDGKTASPSLMRAAIHSEARYETAETVRGIRSAGSIEVRVEWTGPPDEVDHTWEPLMQVSEDLPGLLADYLHTSGDRDLKRRALSECGLSL